MAILALTAALLPPPSENPYGLLQALQQGGVISWSVFIILVGMSIFTFYILFTKLMQQQKIISQGRKVRASFWNSPNLREAANEARGAQRLSRDRRRRAGRPGAARQADRPDRPSRLDGRQPVPAARVRSATVSAKASPSSRPSVRPLRSSVCSVPSSASTARSSRSVRPARRRSTLSPARSVKR